MKSGKIVIKANLFKIGADAENDHTRLPFGQCGVTLNDAFWFGFLAVIGKEGIWD